MNLARLNHILIPDTKAGRDRLRGSRLGRWIGGPLTRTYLALSPEGRGLLVFTAVASLAGLDVLRTETHWLWSLLFALLLGSLAVRRLFPLRGVTIDVSGPRRARVGAWIELCVSLRNAGEQPRLELCIDRPFLPWDGAWAGAPPAIAELRPGEERSVTTRVRFSARGEHHLDVFAACARVPLGLARGPTIESSGLRLTVLPAIAPIGTLELPTAARHQPGGIAQASVAGEALELVGVRPYRPGDRLRDLHAKTWARTGQPAVREYQQEYFSRVGVLLDTDRTLAREPTLEAAISLAAGCVARLSHGEALIDLLVAGDTLHELMLGRGLGQLDQALDHLAAVTPARGFDAEAAARSLLPYLPRLSSMVLVLLGFDAPRRGLAEAISSRGVGVRVIVVGAAETRPSDVPSAVTWIPAARIASACAGRGEIAL